MTTTQTALDEHGWVLLPGLLGLRDLARLRRAFDVAAAEHGTQHVRLSAETPEPAAWEALRWHAEVLAAAEHVLGAPAEVRDLHGRNPLPGFGQQGLHADWMPRQHVRPFFVATALWMIDDFRTDNGATRLVPRSHLLVRPLPRGLAVPGARHPDEVVVTGNAGSVLVFNGHLWHGGRRNESRGPRRSAQMVLQAQKPRGHVDPAGPRSSQLQGG